MKSVWQFENAVKMLNSSIFMVIIVSVLDVLQSIEETKKMQNLSWNSNSSYHVLEDSVLIVCTFHFNLQLLKVSNNYVLCIYFC